MASTNVASASAQRCPARASRPASKRARAISRAARAGSGEAGEEDVPAAGQDRASAARSVSVMRVVRKDTAFRGTLSLMPRRGEEGSGLLFGAAGGPSRTRASGAARKDAPLADRIRPQTLD